MSADPGFIADIADDDGDVIRVAVDGTAVFLTVNPDGDDCDCDCRGRCVALKAVQLEQFAQAWHAALVRAKEAGNA